MYRLPARIVHTTIPRNAAAPQNLGVPHVASLAQRCLWKGCVTRHLTSKAPNCQEEDSLSSLRLHLVAGVNSLSNSHRRQDAEVWVAALDLYLPRGLQQSATEPFYYDHLEQEATDLQGVLKVLAAAKRFANVDLLSYLGIQKERWLAVNWLLEAMLLSSRENKQDHGLGFKNLCPLWSFNEQTLDEITSGPIVTEMPEASYQPIEALYGLKRGEVSSLASVGRQCLGYIWQALGSMILGAENRRRQGEEYQSLMSQAMNTLAQMHHSDALPETMYDYATAKDDSVVQRPPTLYLLSSRIMTVLSDVAWKRHWVSEMAKAKDYGYELPQPRVQPQLPPVGAEIWLEFVLWACVEGGWISEAAWIVSEMGRHGSPEAGGWSTISWQDICETKAPKLQWTHILKLQIDRARLNQSTGIGIANSGTSSIDMGPRTVSCEVICAIMDGVTNVAAMTESEKQSELQNVRQCIDDCMRLLGRGSLGIDGGVSNALLLRIVDSASLNARENTLSMSQILHMNPVLRHAYSPGENSSTSDVEGDLDLSASLLGLLHRILFAHANWGSYPGVLETLEDIQNIIDANRNTYIQEFADDLRERLRQGQPDPPSMISGKKRAPPVLQPQIPPHVISQILDFVVENKLTEMGRWLMHNDDIDGGIIQPHMYESTNLQPALLRFATATSDSSLLNRILEKLEPPLSDTTLHALLRCQVTMNKWSAVVDILRHFQNSPGLDWHASDALVIGAAVLRLSTLRSSDREMARQARRILLDLLQGRLDTPQDPSQRKDLSKIQEANQLKRMLRSVPGSSFEFIAYDHAREAGRLSSRVLITGSAFNILLEEVVEQFGSSAGQKFWQQWCLGPNSRLSRQVNVFRPVEITGDAEEKVVSPKLYMLRTITRPLTQRLRHGTAMSDAEALALSDGEFSVGKPASSEPRAKRSVELSCDDISLLKWAVPLFRSFQMDDIALNSELPGVSQILESAP